MMINDDDCDIEPLREADFECGTNGEPPLGSGHCIQMTNLASLSTYRRGCEYVRTTEADLNSWQSRSSRPRCTNQQEPQ